MLNEVIMKRKSLFFALLYLFLSLCIFTVGMSRQNVVLSQNTSFFDLENDSENIGNPDIANSDPSILTIANLSWTVGYFEMNGDNPLVPKSLGSYDDYNYLVEDNLLYFNEDSTYQSFVGAYALVPVTNGYLEYKYDARIKAGHPDAVQFYSIICNPSDGKRIAGTPYTGCTIRDRPGYLDTGFNTIRLNFSIPDLTEVYLSFLYPDYHISNWEVTLWIQNLEVYTDTPTPINTELHPISDLTSLDWTATSLTADLWGNPLTPVAGEEFTHSINESHLYFAETAGGTGGADVWAGLYTLIPLDKDYFCYSYEYRADSRIYSSMLLDPDTMKRIPSHIGVTNVGQTNTTWQYAEFNMTNLSSYDEVLLFIAFYDESGINNGLYYWVRNLQVSYQFGFDDTPPLISGPDDLFTEVGSVGNYINWTLQDDNPANYTIYRNDVELTFDTWIIDEIISVNVDYLISGVYNYTIVVFDTYGNKALDTVILTVYLSLDSDPPLITGPDDFTVESGTVGNFINWTVMDDNPDLYEIYRNDYLLDSDAWDSSENISINIDYLADGIHNYTIVVYDTFGNYAKDTVLVTVIAYFESSYPFAILTILVLGICIISTVTRRKRKKEV